jgi:cytochrome c oxidase assembly protein subunit 11
MNRLSRNTRTVVVLSGVVVAMVGLTFASVPLYRLFCQVTGYGGTTQVSDVAPEAVGERVVKVRFNADVDSRLPWAFQPVQREVALRVGEVGMAFYRAHNPTKRAITGTAVFNVSPLKAGLYFNKVECFCFEEQRLEPGQSIDMPVTFFVDPAINEDPNLDDVRTITLSYTFFQLAEEGENDEDNMTGRSESPSAGRTTQEASLR